MLNGYSLLRLAGHLAEGQVGIDQRAANGYARAGQAQDKVGRRGQEGGSYKHQPGQDKGVAGEAVSAPPDLFIGQGPGRADTEEVVKTRLGR